MRTFTLACFIGLVFLLLACLFTANAKDADKKLEASGNRLTVRSEKNGKKTVREFPMMFDIAERSAKTKAKNNKAKSK